METLSLSVILLRVNKETAISSHQPFLNLNPSFQRKYEAWNDKLKTRFIETILIGRAMNPIWTILNEEDGSDEVLDGMHRLSTALSYLNNEFSLNKNYMTINNAEDYINKKFNQLTITDQSKIRIYSFIFNKLDSSYSQDKNKLKDMYEILNRSSKTLNDYEFNKVLYVPFYELIDSKKSELVKLKIFSNLNDSRGKVETEIIEIIVISYIQQNSQKSWSSISNLTEDWLRENIGETSTKINEFIEKETGNINDILSRLIKFIELFYSENLFSNDKKLFNTFYLPYKFILARCIKHFKNISLFNRHYKQMVEQFKKQIFEVDIQQILSCKSRNASFQKKILHFIDNIIIEELNKSSPRTFTKSMISTKLTEQNNLCNICKLEIKDTDHYHADHIKAWTSGGDSTPDNLQILHKRCHELKHNG